VLVEGNNIGTPKVNPERVELMMRMYVDLEEFHVVIYKKNGLESIASRK